MRRLLPLVLVALVGCPAQTPVATRSATPKPPAKATPKPSAKPSSATSAAPLGGKLGPPKTAFREVTGVVQVEAAYAVLKGGATVVSNNGAGVVRLGDAALIGNNGSNLIANNGGSIISDNGGGLVSNNGGSIISDNGGPSRTSLSSRAFLRPGDRGYRLVSRFGLLQAAEPEPPLYGLMLPAAGLTLGIVDLASGTLVPLGQDPGGRPADAVVTDAEGGFKVYLPEDAAATSTLRVVGVPRDGADPRLRSALITRELGGRVLLDEDTQRVAADVRQIMATNFYRAITTRPDQVDATTATFRVLLTEAQAAEINAGSKELIAAFAKAGVPALPKARQLAIADRLADVVIANVDPGTLRALSPSQISPLGFKEADPGEEGEPALALFGEVMAKARRNVAKVMAAEQQAGRDPEAYFAKKPYLQEATDRDGPVYAIKKPADFGDFLIRGVQANPALDNVTATLLFATILTDDDLGLGSADAQKLVRAQAGISIGLTIPTYTGPDKCLPAVLKALELAAK